MKRRNYYLFFFVVVLVLMSVTACKSKNANSKLSKEALEICGSWAYSHDEETEIVVFREDGTAKYENKEYTFECDSQFIKLEDADGEALQLRYEVNDRGIVLYMSTTYTYSGEGEPDGLVGEWSAKDGKWSYIFTEGGEFLEDGYFPGTYTVNEKDSTFNLNYLEQYYDELMCYYQIEGNMLHIKYPWQMVKTEAK